MFIYVHDHSPQNSDRTCNDQIFLVASRWMLQWTRSQVTAVVSCAWHIPWNPLNATGIDYICHIDYIIYQLYILYVSSIPIQSLSSPNAQRALRPRINPWARPTFGSHWWSDSPGESAAPRFWSSGSPGYPKNPRDPLGSMEWFKLREKQLKWLNIFNYWLAVEPPIWIIWVNWDYYSQDMEK